jgi:hypothetical protein
MPRKKSPVTKPGIDPWTFRLVAQRLNHYATPGPYINTSVVCKCTKWCRLRIPTCFPDQVQKLQACRITTDVLGRFSHRRCVDRITYIDKCSQTQLLIFVLVKGVSTWLVLTTCFGFYVGHHQVVYFLIIKQTIQYTIIFCFCQPDVVHSYKICICDNYSSSGIENLFWDKDTNNIKSWVCDLGRGWGGVVLSNWVHSCLTTLVFCGVTVNWLPGSALKMADVAAETCRC